MPPSLPKALRKLPKAARYWGAVIWPAGHPGYLLMVAQYDDNKAIALAEFITEDWRELTRRMAIDFTAKRLERIYHEGGRIGDAYAPRVQRMVREEGITPLTAWNEHATLPLSAAYSTDNTEYLMTMLRDWIAEKRLRIGQQVKELRRALTHLAALEMNEAAKQLEQQAAALALSWVLTAMDTVSLIKTKPKQPWLEPSDPRTGV